METDGMPPEQFRDLRTVLGPQGDSNLVTHAIEQLTKHGLYKEDADYGGMLGAAVETLIRVFAAQGHSGFSAGLTIELFTRLAKFEDL